MLIEDLYDYTLARARESAEKRELRQVADDSGVDYSWLGKFALGRIPGASYKKVHQLAMYYRSRLPVEPPVQTLPAHALEQHRKVAA